MDTNEVNRFLKENKNEIIVVTCMAVTAGIGLALWTNYIYKKGFRACAGPSFHATIHWFDKTFEGLDLAEKWTKWALENPDMVIGG